MIQLARGAAQQPLGLRHDLAYQFPGRLDGGDEVGPFPRPDQGHVRIPALMAEGELLPGLGAGPQFFLAPVPGVEASGSEGRYRPLWIEMTVWRDTPSAAATSAWDSPRCLRCSLTRFRMM